MKVYYLAMDLSIMVNMSRILSLGTIFRGSQYIGGKQRAEL